MTAEVVNLRRARKTRERAVREAEAAANRAKHGTPTALRHADAAARSLSERRLEGHKLERDVDGLSARLRDDREP